MVQSLNLKNENKFHSIRLFTCLPHLVPCPHSSSAGTEKKQLYNQHLCLTYWAISGGKKMPLVININCKLTNPPLTHFAWTLANLWLKDHWGQLLEAAQNRKCFSWNANCSRSSSVIFPSPLSCVCVCVPVLVFPFYFLEKWGFSHIQMQG